jgi:hypothetical protein
MQASQYYLKLVKFMDSCKDEEMLEVFSKITNITFVDAQVDFNISLGFNTRGCRVVEDGEEKCVYEIENNKLYIIPEEKNDVLDKVQDTYKEKIYEVVEDDGDVLDKVQDTYKEKIYELIEDDGDIDEEEVINQELYRQKELEWEEKQALEWEQEEEILADEIRYHEYMREQQEYYDESEYTTEKVIDQGKVGHWSDDDSD